MYIIINIYIIITITMNYHDRWFVVRSVGLSPFPKKSAKLQFHDPNGVLIIAIVIIVIFFQEP